MKTKEYSWLKRREEYNRMHIEQGTPEPTALNIMYEVYKTFDPVEKSKIKQELLDEMEADVFHFSNCRLFEEFWNKYGFDKFNICTYELEEDGFLVFSTRNPGVWYGTSGFTKPSKINKNA
jgi:hypothetical protein